MDHVKISKATFKIR